MVSENVWKSYIKTGELPEDLIEPVVKESWQRSNLAGLDAMLEPKKCHLHVDQIKERQRAKLKLIRGCRPITANLAKVCQQHNLLIVVADEAGVIIDISGDIKALNSVQDKDLAIGSTWLEEMKGTNAIGTVVVTKEAVELCGYDHYFSIFHNWHCCGAPIINQAGSLEGVIAIIHPFTDTKVDLLSVVSLAAQNVHLQMSVNNKFEQLHTLSELNTYLMDNIPYAVISLEKNGTVNHFNRGAEALFGRTAREVIGRSLSELLQQTVESGDIGLETFLTRSLQTGQAFNSIHQSINTKNSHTKNFIINSYPVKNQENHISGVIGVIKEVTTENRREALVSDQLRSLENSNVKDGLTQLYNHKIFHEKLEEVLASNKQNGVPVSVLLLDIDHFKHYNEVMGFDAGDKILVEIALLLRKTIRGRDIVARYRGGQFSAALNNVGPKLAIEIATRVKNTIECYPFDGREVQPRGKVTVSMGIASYPDNADNKEELVKAAEEALRKAQSDRNNKISFYFTVFDELKKELSHLDLTLLNTIRTLISVINAKDKYTYGHSERVVLYSTALAQSIGLSEEEIKFLRYGAYLHDIGKIEISREILNKKDPLTTVEWEALKNHPKWGAEIVKPVSALKPILPQILHHHERFDGRGYPAGLAGKDIPLSARILTIADCFDAMTTNRPYQNARSPVEALEDLKLYAGTIFDPELIPEFIEVIKQIDVQKLVQIC